MTSPDHVAAVRAHDAQHQRSSDLPLEYRAISDSLVVSSTDYPGASWAWLYSVAPSGDVWLIDFAGAKASREDAEREVLRTWRESR
jgi:hypothetical protein